MKEIFRDIKKIIFQLIDYLNTFIKQLLCKHRYVQASRYCDLYYYQVCDKCGKLKNF